MRHDSTSKPAAASAVPPVAPWRRGLRVHAAAYRLEERIMLDAAGAATADAVGVPAQGAGWGAEQATAQDPAANDAVWDESRDAFAPAAFDDAPARREVVVVDTSVGDHEDLLAGLSGADDPANWTSDPDGGAERFDTVQGGRAITVYRVDGAADGVDGVTAVLRHESDVDALHVLSHGDVAAIAIGGERIDAGSIDAHRDALATWGAALNADGDILLYGCDTAGTAEGVAFVSAFADATRGDVAASDDPTGHATLGGDWALEVHAGSIETDVVVNDDGQAAFVSLLASAPSATLAVPDAAFLNESFAFTVTVDNTGTDAGYEPYVDLFAEPGARLDGASFLGAAVELGDALTWSDAGGEWTDAGGAVVDEHPLNAAIPMPADPGIDGVRWYTVEFPFGSFVPDQPAAVLTVNATLDKADGAAAGAPLAIRAQAGFEYGENAFDDPDADPVVVGALASDAITPTILEIGKEAASGGPNAVGDEDEHATGPNNPITWTITVDVADGETVDSVVIEDVLGGDIHYTGNLVVSGTGVQVGENVADATAGVSADNALTVSFASVTGTGATDDVVIEYEGYIPDIDASGGTVLDPATAGADTTVRNVVTIDADYEGNALARDGDEHEIRPLSLATQKSVTIVDVAGNPTGASTVVPGDFLEWRLEVQVSDYYSLEGFELVDTFGDGHLYVTGSETLQAYSNGASAPAASIDATNVALDDIDPATGDTVVTYDVAAELVRRGASEDADPDGRLDGDLVDGVREGKTTFVVTFRTQVQERFQYPAVFGGDDSVDVGDRLDNRETVSAAIVASGSAVADGSAASVRVSTPESSKSIYAIDGDTSGFDAADAELTPGQSVTYRITIELPTTDVENLVVTDYLPLPVFAVPTDYAYAGQLAAGTAPAAGEWGFGPATDPDDFPSDFFASDGDGGLAIVDPVTNAAANSVSWNFASFDRDGSTGGTVDILFTTATQDVRFADGLNLTNQALIDYDNTNNPQAAVTEIVQIETLAPELSLSKGIVALSSGSGAELSELAGPSGVAFADAGSGGPIFIGTFDSADLNASPIDADARRVDAGDIVRFAVTVENTGGFSATDLSLADSFPAGFELPAGGANVRAALADGTELVVTGNLFDASGVPDPVGVRIAATDGTELVLERGRTDAAATTDGRNIVVLAYDLVVAEAAVAEDRLENTAELLSFAAFDGGTDYTASSGSSAWIDTAEARVDTVEITKTLVGTSIVTADNARTEAVVGEYVTYEVTLAIPEGSLADANVLDRLDAGLRFDSVSSVTASSSDLRTDLGGGTSDVANFQNADFVELRVDGVDRQFVRMDLGNIVNSNVDDTVPETLTIVYRAFVIGSVPVGSELNNRADVRWNRTDGGTSDHRALGDNVTIIAPKLELGKLIEGVAPTDVGDPVSYRITIGHASGSTATAFDASLTDVLPTQIAGATIDSVKDAGDVDVTATAGFALAGDDASGYTLSNPDFDLAEGESYTIVVSGTVNSATSGAPIENVAELTWTTLDDGAAADGRDADEASFAASAAASFTIAPPELVKNVVSTGIGGADGQLVQGERIDYEVIVTVPEGVTPDAVLLDRLPDGLEYVPGSVTVSSPSPGVTFAGPSVSEPSGPGGTLRLDFGTIENTDRDNATVERIVVGYSATSTGLGATEPEAVDGDGIRNRAVLRWDLTGDGDAEGADDGVSVAVSSTTFREAVLRIDNEIVARPVDAGDAVDYRITVSHAPGSTVEAYDVTLADALPPELRDVALVSATHSGDGDVAALFDVAGNALTSTDAFDLAPGETVTLLVRATVGTEAAAGTRIDNVAEVSWESLGDDSQGIVGAASPQAGQSTASDSSNDAFTMASPTFARETVSTGIATSANDDTEVAAGEYAVHTLTVTVPEGTTLGAVVTDVLAPGLEFDPEFTPFVRFSADTTSAGLADGGPIAATLGTDGNGGTSVAFDLGDVRNAAPNDGDAETVAITYRTYTAYAPGSAPSDPPVAAPGDALEATATLVWDANADGDSTDAADGSLQDVDALTVVHPGLTLASVVTAVPADAADPDGPTDSGNAVRHEYAIGHAPGATGDALAASFSSDFDPAISDLVVTDGNDDPLPGFVVTGDATNGYTVSNPDFDLELGQTLTVVVTGTVNDTAVAGETIGNEAALGWSTLGDADHGPASAARTASASASDGFVIASPTLVERTVATGIVTDGNAVDEVVAGEYAMHRLTIEVPEGTTELATLVDALAEGLDYDAGFAPLVTPSAGVTYTGSAAPAVTDPADPSAPTTVRFDLGTVANSNGSDATPDTITVEYRTITANVEATPGVAAPGTSLAADTRFAFDGDADGAADEGLGQLASSVTVIHPRLAVSNTILTVPGDGGDAVTYRYEVGHTGASTADAFDAAFATTLPGTISNVALDSVTGGAAADFALVVDPATGETSVTNPDFDLAFGDVMVVTVTGTLNETVEADSTVDNAVDVSWQTLGEAAHGDDGDAAGPGTERTGTASAASAFTVESPAFDKRLVGTGIDSPANATGQVVAGERVAYELTVTLPEGTTRDAVVIDTLDPGLVFHSAEVVAVGPAGDAVTSTATGGLAGVSPTWDPAARTVRFELGDLVNAETDDAAPETVVIRYTAYADAGVPRGTALDERATFHWDADGDGASEGSGDGRIDTGNDTVTVLAPELGVTQVVSTIPDETGDTVEYTVTIAHAAAGDADAFDVTFSDVVPAGVENLAVASVRDGAGTDLSGPVTAFAIDRDPGTGANVVSHAGFDLARGDVVVLTLTGTAGPALVAGDTYEADASIGWTSLDDGDPDDGVDAADTGESAGAASAAASFSLSDIVKGVVSTGIEDGSNGRADVVAGEYVTYRIVVDVPQGASDDAAVVDVLDAGLAFDPAGDFSVTPTSGAVTTDAPGGFGAVAPAWDPATRTLGIELGSLSNAAPQGTVERLVIEYRAYADGSVPAGSAPANELSTSVRFERDVDGDGRRDGLQESTSAAAEPVAMRAAALQVGDTVTTATNKPAGVADAGDTIVHALVVSHAPGSEVGAFDASFAHVLPAEHGGLRVVSAVDAAGNPVAGFAVDPATNSVVNPDFDLALGDSITVTVESTLTTVASASTAVADSVAIDWDGLGDDAQGVQALETTGTAAASAAFRVGEPAFARNIVDTGIDTAANDDLNEVVAGERIVHELVVTVPEGTTPMAAITETLGAGTAFDPDFPVTVTLSPGVALTGTPGAPTTGTGPNGLATVGFELGTVTNTDVDDAAPDTITIRYATHAAAAVVDGDALGVDSTFAWDADADGANDAPDDGLLTGTDTVSVIAPELTLANTVTRVPTDTGDTIRYEVVIRHSGASTADAYDLAFADAIPADVENVALVSATDANGDPVAGFRTDGNAVVADSVDLAFGDTITLVVEGTMGADLVEGDAYEADATLTWTTLDARSAADPAGAEDGAADGLDAAEGASSTDARATFSLAGIVKTLVATGVEDASNARTDVVAGEYVDYRIVVDVPRGASPDAAVIDVLDAGLAFDSTSAVTVSSPAITTDVPGGFADLEPTWDAATGTLAFELGNLANAAPDGTVERLVIEYRAYVDPSAARGDALATAARFERDVDGVPGRTGDQESTSTRVEPVTVRGTGLQVTDTVTTPANEPAGVADAGDVLVHTLVVSHAPDSEVGAFDASLTHSLPPEHGELRVVSAVDAAGNPVAGFSVDPATGSVVNPDFDLALGDRITVTVESTVTTAASAGTAVADSVTLDWDGLGDDAQGVQAVEATGTASASSSFRVGEPAFARNIVDTGIDTAANDELAEVVAGERIVHELVVTVPEGTTPMAAVTETLGAGTAFDSDFPVAVTTSPGVAFTGTPGAPAVAGSTVTFDLGTVTNTDVDDAAPDTIAIRYATHATGAVADGDVLSVDSALAWDADADGANDAPDDGLLTGTDTVSVIAPELAISNTVVRVPSDIGDPIRYEIAIRHVPGVSTADAYDLAVAHALPAGVENVAVVSATDANGDPVAGFRTDGNAVVADSVDLAFGDTITLVVEGTMGPLLVEGDTIRSVADVAWSSLDADARDAAEDGAADGTDAAERTASGSASSSFSLGDASKRIVATGIDDGAADPALLVPAVGSGAPGAAPGAVVVAGEWVEYEIVFEVPQGTSEVAELVDVLDPGLVFDEASGIVVTPSSGAVTTTLGAGDFGDAAATYGADTLRVALGDVANAAPIGTIETLTITYRAHVSADEAVAAPGATLDANAANLRWDIDGDGANDGALDGSTDASAPALVVAAPELAVTNDVTRVPGEHGDRIEYTFTIAHTEASTAGASDVRFVDALPASVRGLVIESATRAGGGAVDGFALEGNALVQPNVELPLGDRITVVVSGTVTPGAAPGDTIPTTATIDWSSLDADDPTDGADALDPTLERTGTASADSGFSVGDVTKTLLGTGIDAGTDPATLEPLGPNGAADVVPGEYVHYEIVVAVPEGGAPAALLVDTLGDGLAFDALTEVRASSSALSTSLPGGFDGVSAPAPGATGTLAFDLGDVASSDRATGTTETITLVYRAIATDTAPVAAGASLGSDVTLRWDIDGDGRSDGALDGATADASEPLTVLEPVVTMTESVDDVDPHLGQRVTFTITLANPGGAAGTDAHDVTVRQALPPELALDLGSLRVDGAPADGVPGVADASDGDALALDVATLAHGQTLVLTFEAVVTADPADADAPLATGATLGWSTLSAEDADDGIEPAERGPDTDYAAATGLSLTPVAPDYAVDVTSDAAGPLAAGDAVRHAVTVGNVGTHLGTGLVVRIPWPGDALDPPASISNGGAYDADAGEVVWRVDALSPDESVTFTVDAAVRGPQGADVDGDPASANDAFDVVASVTDDGVHGADPDGRNDAATAASTIDAAPDYVAAIDNGVERASPTGEVPYRIDVANVGTQTGTNVVVVHRFDPAIVTIVDPAGGTVDVAAGTLTWLVPEFAAGEALRYEFTAEVLPDAFLDTPDQLFAGTVDVTDDARNGVDPTPGDNAAEHSDMLLGGPGDPAALIGILDGGDGDAAAASAFSGADGASATTDAARADRSAVLSSGADRSAGDPRGVATGPGTRVLTLDAMRELDGEDLLLSPAALRGDVPGHAIDDDPHARLGEDDPLDGGDLLDVFRNDVRTCEAIGIDWTRWEPTAEDLGLEAGGPDGPAPPDRGAPVPTSADDAGDAGDAGDAPDLRASLAREYVRLHGPAEPDLVAAFRAAGAEPSAGGTPPAD